MIQNYEEYISKFKPVVEKNSCKVFLIRQMYYTDVPGSSKTYSALLNGDGLPVVQDSTCPKCGSLCKDMASMNQKR